MIEVEKFIVQADAGELLSTCFDGEKASLIFADPPFNTGYKYDQYRDRMKPNEYLAWCKTWLSQCYLALSPTGSLWLMIGSDFAAELRMLAKAIGFYPRQWCIWHFTFGVNNKRNFTPAHIHLMWFSKDHKRWTFNADAIRIPSARQTKYKDKRANPAGRLPDTVWTVSRVCGTFKERTGHPCQTPEQILDRIIKVSSNPGDLVIDPFGGSFTTATVAAKLGRRFLSCDISENYVAAGRKRVAAAIKEAGVFV